jgi:hypothetical protein
MKQVEIEKQREKELHLYPVQGMIMNSIKMGAIGRRNGSD